VTAATDIVGSHVVLIDPRNPGARPGMSQPLASHRAAVSLGREVAVHGTSVYEGWRGPLNLFEYACKDQPEEEKGPLETCAECQRQVHPPGCDHEGLCPRCAWDKWKEIEEGPCTAPPGEDALRAQRDELVEALRGLRHAYRYPWLMKGSHWDRARNVLAKVERSTL
jgi:hypothetical protein